MNAWTLVGGAAWLYLGFSGLPLLRLLGGSSMRRVFPGVWLGLALLWMSWFLGLLYLLMRFPVGLLLLAAGAWIWNRLSVASPKNLPPGPLSLVATLEAICDADFYLRQSRSLGPIFKMLQFHRPVVCVLGIERTRALLSQHRECLGPCPLPFHHHLTGGFLRYMDADLYSRYGPAFRRAMSKPVIGGADPVSRSVARQQLLRVAEGSTPLTAALHLITEEMFFRRLLGFRDQSPLEPALREEYARFCRQPYSTRPRSSTLASLQRFCSLLGAFARQQPEAGVLAELSRVDPELPDIICLENLAYIMRISASNTAAFLHWLLVDLASHPSWWVRLKAEPGEALDRVMQETLRLHQSEYLYRRVTRPFEFEGWHFPQGWLLRFCLRESHLDPKFFADPRSFNPDRFLQSGVREGYSPFGMFEHACNGVALNQVIGRLVLEELMLFGQPEIEASGQPVRDFRHWSHWRPGCRVRIRA